MPMSRMPNKKRMVRILLVFSILFLALLGKIAWIQVFNGAEYQEMALDQWTRSFTIEADRGDILDRNGQVLAESTTVYSVTVTPLSYKDDEDERERVISNLSEILSIDKATLEKKVKDTSSGQVWIARKVTSQQSDAIRDLELKGVQLVVDTQRVYPQNDFLTQVLGYTTVDGTGQEGLELEYNKYLEGQDGREIIETDRDGNAISFGTKEIVEAVQGDDLILNIDYVIQYFLEKAMDEAIVINNPKSITGIVLDPNTGEVLAMASKPDFNLNEVPRDDTELLQSLSRNLAVSDAYEMGSTFKIITLAAALEEGVVDESSTFTCTGSKTIDGIVTKCWKTHGTQTLAEAVQNSCNSAFMDMGLRLGTEKLYEYIEAFGLMDKTEIEALSEGNSIVMDESNVKSFDLARISFGQSIAITPIQLASAVSAAINGGELKTPHIVSSIVDNDGNVVKSTEEATVRRVISEATSAKVRALLESVVANGSGKNAQISGYRVGGKTGTAQKYENGQIAVGKNVSSFIGFAPADDPQFLVLFIVDEPAGVSSTFGSIVAAPYVKSILEETLHYRNIAPTNVDQDVEFVEVPDVRNKTYEQASKALAAAGFTCSASDKNGLIKNQMPQAGAKITKGSNVLLYTNDPGENDSQTPEAIEVPNVVNMNMDAAKQKLEGVGLKASVIGKGIVKSQSVTAGTKVLPNTQIEITCEED